MTNQEKSENKALRFILTHLQEEQAKTGYILCPGCGGTLAYPVLSTGPWLWLHDACAAEAGITLTTLARLGNPIFKMEINREIQRITFDAVNRTVLCTVPPGYRTDMWGFITYFRWPWQSVDRIVIIVGGEQDAIYVRGSDGWQSSARIFVTVLQEKEEEAVVDEPAEMVTA